MHREFVRATKIMNEMELKVIRDQAIRAFWYYRACRVLIGQERQQE